MQNHFPPLKRQKHGIDLGKKCLYCGAQELQNGTCTHSTLTCRQQLSMEYQQLQAAAEDPSFDMDDIERRLRKLETQLTLHLKGEKDDQQPPIDNNKHNHSALPSTSIQHSRQYDPVISLTSTGISISTNLVESHHFFKHLVSGINPTFVREKAAEVYSRRIDLAGPVYDNPITQGISKLAMDTEDHEEQVWFDMVLTTRYAKCFLVYQMVELDRLVEWVSPAYINNLKGQVKLEHSLLSKSVRAFVYSHEKFSSHDQSPIAGGVAPDFGQQQSNAKMNRDVFFFQQAEELLELCYLTSNRNTIRALLHMYMYQVMTPGGHTKAVHYSDLALRMAQALKLNTEKGMLVNNKLREDDRRLWWSTVWIHLWSCVALQRPLMVDTSDIIVPGSRAPSKRPNESSQVGYCIDLCVHSVKLLLLSRSISQRLGSKTSSSSSSSTEAKLLWELKDMEHQLDAWSLALPEPLQPRFWNTNSNNTPSTSSLDNMDDTGHHDHDLVVSAQAFAIEIGLMLQGLGMLAKSQLYECYGTNDGTILDLLVARNRLQVAMDFVSHLAPSIHRIRPCVNLIVLTLAGISVSTLIAMVTYPHNPEVTEQAVQHLLALKHLLQSFPFTDGRTAQKWVFDIDRTLEQHGPLLVQQQQVGNTNGRLGNINGPMMAGANDTISTQRQEFHYPHLHQYPSGFHNNINLQLLNVNPALFTTHTRRTPSSSAAAAAPATTAVLDDRAVQQYQVYGSPSAAKPALLDGLNLYKSQPPGVQPQSQIQHLSPGQYVQTSSNTPAAIVTPSSSYIPTYSNSSNITMAAFEIPQTHAMTQPPSLHGNIQHYGYYQQQQQPQQLQQPSSWLLSRGQVYHLSGSQPNGSPPDHPTPPPPHPPSHLDPDQHPFLPYPSTDQHDYRPYE